jgi:hypothetical protein
MQWIGIAPVRKGAHRSSQAGCGYAVLDDEGHMLAKGRFLREPTSRAVRVVSSDFVHRVLTGFHWGGEGESRTVMMELVVQAPHGCRYPFNAGRELGSIEGQALGLGVPLEHVELETWRRATLRSSWKHAEPGRRALELAAKRWQGLDSDHVSGIPVAEAAWIAEYGRARHAACAGSR